MRANIVLLATQIGCLDFPFSELNEKGGGGARVEVQSEELKVA